MTAHQPAELPDDLPRPVDDGAADHLLGTAMPPLALPSTTGASVRIDVAAEGSRYTVIYAYPMTGLPGVESPSGWDAIPGARGCTPESCGFRDHARELNAAGAAVRGLSTQSTAYQSEAATRLGLPYPLLSDARLDVTEALRLPTFAADLRPEHDGGGRTTLLKRLTMVVRDGYIAEVFYPVFPPDEHAAEVLAWLRANAPASRNS